MVKTEEGFDPQYGYGSWDLLSGTPHEDYVSAEAEALKIMAKRLL